MVKNKRELLAIAAEWTNHAKNDLRNQLINFMEHVGADQNRIADALGLSIGEVEQILNGNGEITLSTFAKLLIATDNVIEIKPMSALRGGSHTPHGRTAPNNGNGRTRTAPNNGNGHMQSPRGGFPTPDEMERFAREHGGIPTPPHPRFGGRNGGMTPPPTPPHAPSFSTSSVAVPSGYGVPTACKEIDLDELSRKELVNLVLEQGLGSEIDLRNASRGEIIDFLEAKQQNEVPQFTEPTASVNGGMPMDDGRVGGVPMEEERPNTETVPNDAHSDERLAEMLLSELSNNPRLRSVVENFMQRN